MDFDKEMEKSKKSNDAWTRTNPQNQSRSAAKLIAVWHRTSTKPRSFEREAGMHTQTDRGDDHGCKRDVGRYRGQGREGAEFLEEGPCLAEQGSHRPIRYCCCGNSVKRRKNVREACGGARGLHRLKESGGFGEWERLFAEVQGGCGREGDGAAHVIHELKKAYEEP